MAAYDANGNVTDLVGTNGEFLAQYQYDPYGNTITKSGDLADVNPFRFSTKYLDSETGLLYYGYRYYQPETGRWLGRDPLEEEGGVNVFLALANNAVNNIDIDGQSIFGGGFNPVDIWKAMDALYELSKAYLTMLKKNTKGADKYYHCIGFCEAGRAFSPKFALALAVLRELLDNAKNKYSKKNSAWDQIYDSFQDMMANMQGINCPDGKTCEECCCSLKVKGL